MSTDGPSANRYPAPTRSQPVPTKLFFDSALRLTGMECGYHHVVSDLRLIDFSRRANAGCQRALHPAGPRRGMVAREMNSSFGCERLLHSGECLANAEIRVRAASPFIVVPTIRRSALVVCVESRMDRLQLRGCRLDTPGFRQLRQSTRVRARRVRHQETSRRRL